jgi:hypothetical protein
MLEQQGGLAHTSGPFYADQAFPPVDVRMKETLEIKACIME